MNLDMIKAVVILFTMAVAVYGVMIVLFDLYAEVTK